MIAKHSHEQSQKGEGVEVVENRPHEVNFKKNYYTVVGDYIKENLFSLTTSHDFYVYVYPISMLFNA